MKKITVLTLIIISQFTFSQAATKISSIDNGGGNFNSGTLSIICLLYTSDAADD